jgi:hypothetical protein
MHFISRWIIKNILMIPFYKQTICRTFSKTWIYGTRQDQWLPGVRNSVWLQSGRQVILWGDGSALWLDFGVIIWIFTCSKISQNETHQKERKKSLARCLHVITCIRSTTHKYCTTNKVDSKHKLPTFGVDLLVIATKVN